MMHTISKDMFKEQMQRLASAFMKKPTKITLMLYWEKLNDFSELNFKKVVENIIDQDSFFPPIARFRQISKPKHLESNNVDPLGDSATHLSLKISAINDDLEEWKTRYKSLTSYMVRADIWPEGHTVDKDKVLQALIKLQEWRNNANWWDFPCHWLIETPDNKKIEDIFDKTIPDTTAYNMGNCSIGRVVGTLPMLCREYVSWIEEEMREPISGEERWLSGGIQEGSLFPRSKMFSRFIEQLNRDISPYPGAYEIKSRGWGEWKDKKMETLDEREEREDRERQERENIEKQKEADEEIKKQNTIWAYACMKKHFSDYDTSSSNLLNVDKWVDRKDNSWESEFESIVKQIEVKHLENPESRSHAYYFLLQRI